MQHAVQQLPENYQTFTKIDLQKNKKDALIVNIAGGAVMVAMALLAHFCFVPLSEMMGTGGIGSTLLHLAVMLAGYCAYMVLHELTHAAVMKLSGCKSVRFGFAGLYAYAGSKEDYFDKPAYIAVALAPLVLWGVIFTVLMIFVPRDWFWAAYFMQIGNIAGAAGDVYVTLRVLTMPRDILVKDTGVDMTVYTKKK